MASLLRAIALSSLMLAAPVKAQEMSPAVQNQLDEAAYALSEGRTLQARTMLGEAVRMGAIGETVERLLADLDFAERRFEQSLARTRMLLVDNPDDIVLLERAGLSTLALGNTAEAEAMLQRAVRRGSDRWRTFNGLGIVADRKGDWAGADAAYGQAAMLGPDQGVLFNNRGWSLMLQGRWEEALLPLTQAVAMAPDNERYTANLALAEMAVSEDLPSRGDMETDEAFAARLNDAGVVAAAQGLDTKAIAAFTRAIEARSQYYERAAANLARIEGDE